MRPGSASLCLVLCAALCITWPAGSQDRAAIPIRPIGKAAFNVMREFFEYDRDMPLDAHVIDRHEQPGYVREKIVLQGVRDSRVPGYLATPTGGAGPFPCVILIHGIGGSKEDWWSEDSFHSGAALTKRLLNAGVAILTLDVEYHGERSANNDFESPEVFVFERGWLQRARNMIVDSVVDHRQAIDYLSTRPEIDDSRIGVVGYSMGGIMAFQLTAVDARISACISCVAPILKEEYSALAVYNFAPFIESTPVLMMIGREDRRNYTLEDAQAVLDLIPGTDRTLRVYESGHKLPIEWTTRAKEWMTARLD